MKYTRGTDTSYALTDIRSVLGRAETARNALERDKDRDGSKNWRDELYRADPEIDEMIAALDEVIRSLDRWRRTGRTR